MEFREAISSDLEAIMEVRFSVKENVLSNPDLVTIADCEDFIFRRGKGWVCVWWMKKWSVFRSSIW